MKIKLDTPDLTQDTDPQELTGLEHVLRTFLEFAHKLQGKPGADIDSKEQESKRNDQPEDPASDIVGDVLINQFKIQQQKAMTPRRESGWMRGSTGQAASCDDRHI